MFQRLSDQNLYEVLDVAPDATSDEIQSAYDTARDMYGHDALVTGSILSEHERRATFDLISEAYQTLIAEESRRLYDRRLGIASRRPAEPDSARPAPRRAEAEAAPRREALDAAPIAAKEAATARPAESAASSARPGESPEPAPKPAPRPVVEPRVSPVQLAAGEEATGAFLKKAREALGLELATISEETKIGRSMLEYIESERLDRLPAPVYLKNFTRQFARCLGLDEDRVAATYVERIARFGS